MFDRWEIHSTSHATALGSWDRLWPMTLWPPCRTYRLPTSVAPIHALTGRAYGRDYMCVPMAWGLPTSSHAGGEVSDIVTLSNSHKFPQLTLMAHRRDAFGLYTTNTNTPE